MSLDISKKITPENSNVKLSSLAMFTFLVSCFFYNLQVSELRLLVLVFWASTGFYLALFPNAKLSKYFIFATLLYLIYFIFSLLLTPSSLKLSIDGSKVEAYTVLLFPVFFAILFNHKEIDVSRVLTISIWALIFFFVLDLIIRYMVEPDCFMNYQCRQQAKTVGLISTTNVTGACIVILFFSILEKSFRFKKTILLLLSLILLTTMARSAIVAFLIVLGLWFFLRSRNWFIKICIASLPLGVLIFLAFNLSLLTDGSLLSKFDFIENTRKIMIKSDLFNLVFGFGSSYDSIVDILGVKGWSPHIPFLKSFLYYGLIGLVLSLFPILYMLYLEKKFFFPLSAYLIISIAGAPIVFPALIGSFLILNSDFDDFQEKNTNIYKQ